MFSDRTITSSYTYENQSTASKKVITDLASLAFNKYFIAHVTGSMNVDGLLTNITDSNGLPGKNTGVFSSDKLELMSLLGEPISFVNRIAQENGNDLYQIKANDGRYLAINDDKTVVFTDTETSLKLRIVGDGQVLFMNKSETMYLNFYAAANKEEILSQFAGWNEIDVNSYMTIYQLD